MILQVDKCVKNQGWLNVFADLEGKQVKKGDTYTFELLSLNSAVDVEIKDLEAVKRLASWPIPKKCKSCDEERCRGIGGYRAKGLCRGVGYSQAVHQSEHDIACAHPAS